MDWRLEKENEEEEKREEETSALLSSSFAKDAKPAPPGTIQNERRGPGGGWDDETIDPSGHCDRNNLHDEEEKGKTSFSSSFFDTATTATEGRWRRQRPEGRGGRATDARTSVAKDDAAMEEGGPPADVHAGVVLAAEERAATRGTRRRCLAFGRGVGGRRY